MNGQEVVNVLTDFVNGAGSKEKSEFIQSMLKQHRTLQQETFTLMLQTMASWADMSESSYDARNAYTFRTSKEIMKIVNPPLDYSVKDIKFDLNTEIKKGLTFSTQRDYLDGVITENWEFTKIHKSVVQEVEGELCVLVSGRAIRI